MPPIHERWGREELVSNLWYFVVLVPSIILHEVSHGWVANAFGDPTARERGRLSLNPLVHIDPFGSVLLPALLVFSGLPPFGWAKPVPVNIARLRNPRRQSVWVSLAGPATNIILSAVGLGFVWYAIHVNHSVTYENIGLYIGIPNLTLAIFNLIPVPPLDGSAVIERLLPRSSLGAYYQFRARALPLVMVLVVVDSLFFHRLNGLFNTIESWWISLAS